MLNKYFICIYFALICTNLHSDEVDLSAFEQRFYSQNGEDGVLLKIFELIGTESKYFVEFGVQDGTQCNTRYLRQERGWRGLLMDASSRDPDVNLQQELITAENINLLFDKYNVPASFDLLSIDIDYNDFYVWSAIEERYAPRVVVIEYNATHLPHEDKVVYYDPNIFWDGTNYFGASILSFYKLARKKGYSLVYAEKRGVNLFFVRDDVLNKCNSTFKNVNCVECLYKYPRYSTGSNGGHIQDSLRRAYYNAEDAVKMLLSP